MLKVMYRSDDSYLSCRAGFYYYIRRVPCDVRQHYTSKRLSLSLKTKSFAGALRAAQFRDWCLDKGMNINSVKRVFNSVRSIINLNIREYGLEGTNAFSGTYMPDGYSLLVHRR